MIRIVLLLWLLLLAFETQADDCDGAFKGKTPSLEQLQQVLAAHRQWVAEKPGESSWVDYLKKTGADQRRANLCGAELSKINLDQADLNGANLYKANLSGAHLYGIDLNGANLSEANLSEAYLPWAYLSEAILYKANLTRTELSGADLREADLGDANLNGAYLYYTNMVQTIFKPLPGKLPEIPSIAYARNLDRMQLGRASRPVLAELREGFKKAGFREAERSMTYLLKVQQEEDEPPLERRFNFLLFNWTCGYGLYPGQPLRLLFALIGLLSPIYLLALTRPQGGGLWALWSADRVHKSEGQADPVRLSFAQPFPPTAAEAQLIPGYLAAFRPPASKPGPLARAWRFLGQLRNAFGLALYFSLLSAFHFGWRDLNVGNWIARVQPREYVLRPTGWVRVVSGLQSLVSVYLVALWVLSYFGRPFE